MFVGMGANSAGGGGYGIENSLRFRNSASAYLNRTASAAPTDGKKVTLSCWVKRGILTGNYYILQSGAGTGNNNYTGFYFRSDNTLQVSMYSVTPRVTTQVFRDSSAWYHFVVAFDTTQGAADDRCKLYVNGEQVTSFSINGSIPLNTLIAFTKQSQANYIGTASDEASYFDGYMTEINLIDGQQLAPTEFGQINEDTGAWEAIEYIGTYGNNGYYLKGRGTDNSGNGNNWTENNFNTATSTATTYDIMTDVPTLTDEDTANYAVFNPLGTNDISTFSEANLKVTTGSGASTTGTTIAMSSGKWYAEFVCTAKTSVNMYIGLVEASTFDGDNQGDEGTNNGYIYSNAGNVYHGGASDTYGASWTVGDVMAIAFDADTRNVTFYKNNVSQGVYTRIASENTGGDWLMVVSEGQGGATATFVANFGQRPFAYTPPTGYLKLNTFNLPDSSIVDGSENFNLFTYTGNGTSQSFTGLGFQPDFVWYKSRSIAGSNHVAFDAVRGDTQYLLPNSTNAEGFLTSALTSFDPDGYSVGSENGTNKLGSTYVSWNWKAGGTAVSNTAGTITSSVSANPTAGFSVVTYTGTGAIATIGHGLGVAPKMIITKKRSSAGDNWVIWHTSLTSGTYILLFTTAAQFSSTQYTAVPSSTVLNLNTATAVNNSGSTYVSYCFAEVEGYSKFGSYTGNGSTDGPFVYTGFRPAFVMVKRTNGVSSWFIHDAARDTYNVANKNLYPNLSAGEEVQTTWNQDMLSNGFKTRGASTELNASGGTYIYMAFAENPFKNSLAR